MRAGRDNDFANPDPADPEAYEFTRSGGRTLVRVVPIVAPLASIQLVSLELYEDGMVVRWIAAPPPPSGHVPLALTDDVATLYRTAGSGAFGSSSVMRGESLFVPRLNPEATQIVLSVGDAALRVDAIR